MTVLILLALGIFWLWMILDTWQSIDHQVPGPHRTSPIFKTNAVVQPTAR